MHVLLTSTDNPYITKQGGKHVHLLLLEQGLKSLGLEVTTLYCRKSLKQITKKAMLVITSEKIRQKYKLKWMIDDLRRRIPKQDFSIVHAHDVLSMIATQSIPQKKVLTLHGYFARENIEFTKNEKDRIEIYPLLLQLEKDGMKNADHIIAVDQRLKEYIMSEYRYPVNKITIIHNAVDTNTFKPVSKERQRELRSHMGLAKDNYVVLVPRRLVEKNGVIYAVRAMKDLKNQNIDMIIVGDGPEKEEILKEVTGDQRVHFIGMIPHDKIIPYYEMADTILVPSTTSHGIQEATSLAMLEGMACGKVVICSSIGGMKEIIRDTENGLLVEEKQPQAIAEAISKTMKSESLSGEIGRNAREYVVQNHSFTAHAARVVQIYQTVLGE